MQQNDIVHASMPSQCHEYLLLNTIGHSIEFEKLETLENQK